MSKNTAHDILWPTDTNIVLRVCFLYVGQGSSILVIVRDGTAYKLLVVDSNMDKANGGIDVPKLVKDLEIAPLWWTPRKGVLSPEIHQ